MDENKIDEVKRKLLNIAADGKVDEQEREELAEVVNGLDDLYKVISELRMMTEQQVKTERK